MKVQTCIVWVNIWIWISLSTVVAESVYQGSKTVCVGSDVDFFCGIIETKGFHIIIIKHKSNEIGRYSTDTGVEVYEKFRHHYLIVKNTFDIQVHLRDVKEEDNGIVSCTVIYKATRVKYEWKLIIQERFTSSVIDFKIRNSDPCTVLTCSANSNLLVLKKPDNELIKGTDIVLDSCYHYLPPGEFTCCLMANCSEAECNEITLEEFEKVTADSSKENWVTVFLSGTALVILVIQFIIYLRETRRYKKVDTPGSKTDTEIGETVDTSGSKSNTGIGETTDTFGDITDTEKEADPETEELPFQAEKEKLMRREDTSGYITDTDIELSFHAVKEKWMRREDPSGYIADTEKEGDTFGNTRDPELEEACTSHTINNGDDEKLSFHAVKEKWMRREDTSGYITDTEREDEASCLLDMDNQTGYIDRFSIS